MKSSTHYFHMRTKILAVFQICISATLTLSFYYMFYIHVIWSFIFAIYFIFMLYVYYVLTINLYVYHMFFIFLFLHYLILNLYDKVFIFIIWSSICIQDIVLHYQIDRIPLIWLVSCIRFVWQINLMKMIIYMFRTQSRGALRTQLNI